MGVEHIALVLHHSTASGTDKLVLLGIANHAGDGGAWPSIRTLATYANVNERSVQRSIGKLTKAGELAVHLQRGGTVDSHPSDWHRPNRYDVLVRCPAWCDRTPQHRVMRGWAKIDDGYAQPDAHLPGLSDSHQSDPVTPASPGDTSVTRGGDTSVTLTVSRTTNVAESVTEPQTREPEQPAPAAVVHSHPTQQYDQARDQLRARRKARA